METKDVLLALLREAQELEAESVVDPASIFIGEDVVSREEMLELFTYHMRRAQADAS